MGISIGHILLVLIIVFVLFGAGKLPQVMAELARGLKAFKKGIDEEGDSEKDIPSPIHSLEKTIEGSKKEIIHSIQEKEDIEQEKKDASDNQHKSADKKPSKKMTEQKKKSASVSSRSSGSKKETVKESKNTETKKQAQQSSASKKKTPSKASRS